jgi:hypothetical protein
LCTRGAATSRTRRSTAFTPRPLNSRSLTSIGGLSLTATASTGSAPGEEVSSSTFSMSPGMVTRTRLFWIRPWPASRGVRGSEAKMVSVATQQARAVGCEWLHVDFDEHLRLLPRRLPLHRDPRWVDQPADPELTTRAFDAALIIDRAPVSDGSSRRLMAELQVWPASLSTVNSTTASNGSVWSGAFPNSTRSRLRSR